MRAREHDTHLVPCPLRQILVLSSDASLLHRQMVATGRSEASAGQHASQVEWV